MNPLSSIYLDVAERSLVAAQATQDRGLSEKTCFLTYHAFESLGGAWAASAKVRYPLSHPKKLNMFVTLTRARPYGRAVPYLAIALASLRNRSLYPQTKPGGAVVAPKDNISPAVAVTLLNRTGGLARAVAKDL